MPNTLNGHREILYAKFVIFLPFYFGLFRLLLKTITLIKNPPLNPRIRGPLYLVFLHVPIRPPCAENAEHANLN